MPRRSINRIAILSLMLAGLCIASPTARAQSIDAQRSDAIRAVPFDRLTPAAAGTIRDIVERPTLYRRLPSRAIDCDPQMFIFLVRHPEVLVGIWERMEISEVQTRRVGPFKIAADDSAGTTCTIDLVYGDARTHVFVAEGVYTGVMAPRPITGSGVFLLRSDYVKGADGRTTVRGTLDCFIQLDNLGADLIARTLSSMIGKTADHNFVETARFIAQVSLASERNPSGMRDLALDLRQVESPTRKEFAAAIIDVARRAGNDATAAAKRPVPFLAERSEEKAAR